MALAITLAAEGVPLSAAQEARVRRHLRPLERRPVHRSEPGAYVQLTWHSLDGLASTLGAYLAWSIVRSEPRR